MRTTTIKVVELDLVKKFKIDDDTQAFAILYASCFDSIYKSVFHILKDNHLAYDITQDAFIKASLKIGKLGEAKHFRSWLGAIARNLCYDHFRVDKRRREIEEFSFLNIIAVDDSERHKVIEEKIAKLNKSVELLLEVEKDLIIRKYVHGEKISYIGDVLNISDSAVKMRLKRVKEKIRTAS